MEEIANEMRALTLLSQPQEAERELDFDGLDAFRLLAEDQYQESKDEATLLRLQKQDLQLIVEEQKQALYQSNALVKHLGEALAKYKEQASASLDFAQALQRENTVLRSELRAIWKPKTPKK